jgi:AcrR family transcriptional regulator
VTRAAPLPPEERRASIIAATLPLLRNHGNAVTTAQIAMASGIAEGTLFRVFPDKESLIDAAICSAFDPAPSERELAQVDRGMALRPLLIAAVEIMQRRVEQIWQLLSMLGMTAPPRVPPSSSRTPGQTADDIVVGAIAAMLEPHRGELRCEPAYAARLVRLMTFAGTHPRITAGQPLTAAEIVAVVLDGVRNRADIDGIEGDPAC